MEKAERRGLFEVTLEGKSDGNPFTDYEIHAEFKGEKETKQVNGFYDGGGVYKVRFMPSETGVYHYKISGSFSDTQTEGSGGRTAACSMEPVSRALRF